MATSEDSDVAMVIMRGPLARTPIRDACSNSECIAMVTSEMRVYVCDLTDASKQHKYVKVSFTTSEGDDKPDVDIVSVCCGRHHFLALSARGRVYSWGKNNYGQLGLRKKKQKHHRGQDKEKEAPKPRLIAELSSYDVVKIACGDNHSLALTRDGRLFCWGSNGNGQLSIGEQPRTRHHSEVPTQVKGLADVTVQHIAAGGAHTAVVSLTGSVYVWGNNSHGQLGLLITQDVKIPYKLKLVREGVKHISCGENSTSFLFKNGELCVFGMGVGMHPNKWYKTELSPGRTDTTHLYSSLQSYGRYTFVVEQSSGKPFVLDHGEVGGPEGPSQYLQLDPLDGTTFDDTFGPEALPEWPHRRDDADLELYKVQKNESADIGAGVVGNQDKNNESMRRMFIIQHKTEKKLKRSVSVRSEMPTLSAKLLQELSDLDETIFMGMNRNASLQEAEIIFSSTACLNASFPTTGPHEVNDLNMDLKAARNAFKLIFRKKRLLEWISEVVRIDLCRYIELDHCCEEDLRFYIILLECPVFRYPHFEWCRKVLTAIGRLLINGKDYYGSTTSESNSPLKN